MADRDIHSDLRRRIKQAQDQLADDLPWFIPAIYEMDVYITEQVPTAGTDGEHLVFNPKYCSKLTQRMLCALLYHEILHCINLHPWRKGEREHMRFNVACDYVINPVVKQQYGLSKDWLYSRKFLGKSSEEVYEILPQVKHELPQQSKNGKSKSGNGQSSESGGYSQGRPGSHKYWPGQRKEKKRSVTDKILGKNKDDVPETKRSPSENKAKWQQIYNDTILDNYGDLPGELKRVVDNRHYVPSVDWESIVADILSNDDSDFSFMRRDRRTLSGDFFLPDLDGLHRLADVVFAFDTSMSITPSQLQSFYSQASHLFKAFPNYSGHVAICDAALHWFGEINVGQPYEEIRRHFKGGGGTAFEPVFDAIEARQLNPKALFYFTDTYGSFPVREPEFDVYWMVLSHIDDFESYPVPFGKVIKFLDKK